MGAARYVYNLFLAYRRELYNLQQKSVSKYDTFKLLTLVKNNEPDRAWLKDADSKALQLSLADLDRAYKNFFAKRAKYPRLNPRPLKKQTKKPATAQRSLCRKKKGSRNREKQRIKLARVHERIANIRLDFLHKLTTLLCRENQTIAVESLNIKGMLKNHKLARAISDVSWGEFFRQLDYKSLLYGCTVLRVPTMYPSSQTCSECGYKNPLVKDLKVREWDCPQCGAHHNRDFNAAINILNKATVGHTEINACGERVRR